MIICSTALINISAFAAATDDTPIYEIVDYYVPKEKETGYDDIRYAEETQKYSDVSEGDNRTINILSALKQIIQITQVMQKCSSPMKQ